MPIQRTSAGCELLFHLVNKLYEQTSVIVTTKGRSMATAKASFLRADIGSRLNVV